jgi:hypothetical protein
MLLDFGGSLTCRCVGCGYERTVPNTDRPRMPARGKSGEGVTLKADTPCPRCRKSSRVRVRLEFEEGPESS